MLMKRLISGGILAIALLAIILYAPYWGVALTFAVLFTIGAWEWAGMVYPTYRAQYTLLVGVLIALLCYFNRSWQMPGFFYLDSLIWIILLIVTVTYTKTAEPAHRGQKWLAMTGLVILPVAWLSVMNIHAIHPFILVYTFALAALADSFAYLAGKRFGRNKLAPDLSPNKTIEGLLGGLLAVFVVAVVAAVATSQPGEILVPFVLLSMLCALASVIGDLFVSLMKRESGVKDAGKILPGHGGILDRFDSHLAVLPLFYIGLAWILGL